MSEETALVPADLSSLTPTELKGLVKQLAYHLQYSGEYLSPGEATAVMHRDYAELLAAAGYPSYHESTCRKHGSSVANERLYASRRTIARQMFAQDLAELQEVNAMLMDQIRAGDVDLVDRLVRVKQHRADLTGIKAPQKMEIAPGSRGDLTEEDKELGLRAVREAQEFEDSLIIEGEVVDNTDDLEGEAVGNEVAG